MARGAYFWIREKTPQPQEVSGHRPENRSDGQDHQRRGRLGAQGESGRFHEFRDFAMSTPLHIGSEVRFALMAGEFSVLILSRLVLAHQVQTLILHVRAHGKLLADLENFRVEAGLFVHVLLHSLFVAGQFRLGAAQGLADRAQLAFLLGLRVLTHLRGELGLDAIHRLLRGYHFRVSGIVAERQCLVGHFGVSETVPYAFG